MNSHKPATPQPPPRRLRLSVIFEQIAREGKPDSGPELNPGDSGARATAHATGTDAAADSASGGWAQRRRRRTRVRSNISVGEILDRTQSAGYGFVLAFLTLCAMPFPGLSVPFGFAIAFGALQMLIGLRRPWMPRVMRRYRLSITRLAWIGNQLTRWTRGLEKFVRPRFEPLTRGFFWFVCGLGVFLMGVGLGLPIPIPYSNLIFAVPLLVYAIGLLESDGLLLMVGHAISAVNITLIVRFGDLIIRKSQELFGWMMSLWG